jgi:serine/threonine protein kinase
VAPVNVIAGRYELGRALGSGAMSDVRVAQDLVLGRQVAVKLFRPGVEPARVRQEVRLHARLSHPGLVAVYDSGTDEQGRTFLVLQLVDGPTLAERVRRSPLTTAEADRVGAALAEALAHLHAHGVVHRDVKPANILLDRDGAPRLADLGIAQEQGQDGLTATGFTLGTVPYLSPEQVRGQTATSASDVYALGLVLLEALTGRREYPGMNAEGALARLSRRPLLPTHLTGVWPALLAAMTADDPGARPAAADVAAALRDPAPATAELPATLLGPTPPSPAVTRTRPAASHRHRRRAAVTAAALLLGVGGLVAVGGTGEQPGQQPEPEVAPGVQPVAVQPVPAKTAPRVTPVVSRPAATATRAAVAPREQARKGKSAGVAKKGDGPGRRRGK